MILAHLVVMPFFNGATGAVNTATTTGLPVLTCLHFFTGYTEAEPPEVEANSRYRGMVANVNRGFTQ